MKINNRKSVAILTLSTLMMSGCISKHELRRTSPQRVIVLPSAPIQTQNIVQSNIVQPNIVQPNTVQRNFVQQKKSWKRLKPLIRRKRDVNRVACISCYATPLNYPKGSSVSKRSFSRVVKKPYKISYNKHASSFKYSDPIDYSKPPSALKNTFKSSYSNNTMNSTKHYGSYAYREKRSDKIASIENYGREKINSYSIPTFSGMHNSYSAFSNNSGLSIQVGAFREYAGAKRYERRYSALSSKYRTTIKTERKENQPIYRVQIEGFKSDVEANEFMSNYGIEEAFLVRR